MKCTSNKISCPWLFVLAMNIKLIHKRCITNVYKLLVGLEVINTTLKATGNFEK